MDSVPAFDVTRAIRSWVSAISRRIPVQSPRLNHAGWAIICIVVCSFIVTFVYLRFEQKEYAEAVSKMDYQLCQSSNKQTPRNCSIQATQTNKLMDSGLSTDVLSAAGAVLLIWMALGALGAIAFMSVRLIRKVYRTGILSIRT